MVDTDRLKELVNRLPVPSKNVGKVVGDKKTEAELD